MTSSGRLYAYAPSSRTHDGKVVGSLVLVGVARAVVAEVGDVLCLSLERARRGAQVARLLRAAGEGCGGGEEERDQTLVRSCPSRRF